MKVEIEIKLRLSGKLTKTRRILGKIGFRVTKPWGETAPYDVATDHHGLFRRVQVKCTLYQRGRSFVCTICSSHVVYTPDQYIEAGRRAASSARREPGFVRI